MSGHRRASGRCAKVACVVLGLVASAGAAFADDIGRIVFSYQPDPGGLCKAGSEVLLSARLSNVPVLLGHKDGVADNGRDCFVRSRHGTKVRKIVVPCSEEALAAKRANPTAVGTFEGAVLLCQSGLDLRLAQSEAFVVVGTENTDARRRLQLDMQQEDAKRGMVRYLRTTIWHRSELVKRASRDGGGTQEVHIDQVLIGAELQDPSILPTDDVYGVKMTSPVAVAFGDAASN